MALTSSQLSKLKEGDTLKYTDRNGNEAFDSEAKVRVLDVWPNGCWIQVIEISSKGPESTICDGDQVAATFAELNIIPE